MGEYTFQYFGQVLNLNGRRYSSHREGYNHSSLHGHYGIEDEESQWDNRRRSNSLRSERDREREREREQPVDDHREDHDERRESL